MPQLAPVGCQRFLRGGVGDKPGRAFQWAFCIVLHQYRACDFPGYAKRLDRGGVNESVEPAQRNFPGVSAVPIDVIAEAEKTGKGCVTEDNWKAVVE